MSSDINVKVIGSGSYLPGDPVSFNEIEKYLGELNDAPLKVRNWLKRLKGLMKEILDVEFYHYALDPDTREFFDDNITMSVKAAEKAIKMSGLKPTDMELIVYGSAHQDQMPTASVRIQEQLGIEHCAELS